MKIQGVSTDEATVTQILEEFTLGPFIREKIRRVLDKTRTARINGTKQAFASCFRRVLAKTRLK